MNEQLNNFYINDKKEYIISKNKNFLKWLNNEINNGYEAYVNTSDIQNLIDIIANWYEIKYPDRYLKENKLSKVMIYDELIKRLPDKSAFLMKCSYRGNHHKIRKIYDNNGNNVDSVIDVNFMVETKYTNYLVSFDTNTGLIDSFDMEYVKEIINIDPLTNVVSIELFKDYLDKNNIECIELDKIINNYKVDSLLRKKILELVALKLLYSNTSKPNNSYRRALLFISEFNSYIPTLNLSSDKIDIIMYSEFKDLKDMVKIMRKSN